MLNNCFTIRVDMDDTIEHLLKAWVAWLNAKYYLTVEYENIREWDMTLNFPTLTEEQVYQPLELKEFWETVQPIEGASEILKQLIEEDGQDVYIVTSPGSFKSVVPKIEAVLHKYFDFIDDERIIIAKDKSMICADIAIDDNIDNLCLYSDTTFPLMRLLFDSPHNRDMDIDEISKELDIAITRVHSWGEVYDIIRGIDLAYSTLKAETSTY